MIVFCEGGLSHDGSLGQAHALTDAVAKAGADVIKWQCHYGDPVTQFRPGAKPFPQDATRQDYWQRTNFTPSQWKELADHACEVDLGFCVSVFSQAAIEYLADVPVSYWKIGSGQVGNLPLVRSLSESKLLIILSSGMSEWKELDAAMSAAGDHAWLMQCTSEYPCPPEHIGLDLIPAMKQRYGVPVGLSDHSGTIWPSILAAAYAADLCEVHVTWSKEFFGPDVAASVTIDELKQLVDGVRFVTQMKSVDKDKMAKKLSNMRKVFCVQ